MQKMTQCLCLVGARYGAAVVVAEHYRWNTVKTWPKDSLAADIEVVAVHQCVHRSLLLNVKLLDGAGDYAPYLNRLTVLWSDVRVGGVSRFKLNAPDTLA